MAYDPGHQRTVLFGGTDNSATFNDTWEWNGEDWTQVADSGPAARSGHAMVFDTARNRTLLFGGLAVTGTSADTWEWDDTLWTQTSSFGPPAC